MKKLKYFIIAIALMLLVLPVGFSFALEINYPTFPGAPVVQCSGTSCITIAQYVQYIFIFAFTIAGIIGVILIVVAGFQILLYAGSPAKISEARERIFNAILGIVILFASFILLNTINPSIVNPRTTVLPLEPGVYLWGYNGGSPPGIIEDQHPDGRVYQQAPYLVSDTNTIPAPFTSLYYNCNPPGRNLLVWVYDAPNYEIGSAASPINSLNTKILPCNGSVPNDLNTVGISPGIGVLSFFWDYEGAGVYYYMTTDCTGFSTWHSYDSPGQITTGSRPRFAQLLGLARSLRIVNDTNQAFNYGVILSNSDESGECSLPVITNGCIGVSDANWPLTLRNPISNVPEKFNPYFVYIIKQDKNYASRPAQSATSFVSPNYFVSLYQDTDIGPMWIDNETCAIGANDCNLDNLIRAQGRVHSDRNTELIPPAECCTDAMVLSLGVGCGQVGSDPTLDPYVFSYDPTRDPPKLYRRYYTYTDTLGFQEIPGRFQSNPDYKGYRSCIDTITANDLYTTIIYTKNYLEDDPDPNKRVFDRKCKIFDSNDIRFHRNNLDTLQLFGRGQEIYRTVIIPTVP